MKIKRPVAKKGIASIILVTLAVCCTFNAHAFTYTGYAHDDRCIAKMAGKTGDSGKYIEYLHRAKHYRNVFDHETGFMRAKMIE